MIEMLFTQALGLVAPWQIKQADFNREADRIDFEVAFGGSRHVCPACGAAAQPFHDRLARSGRHLDFFRYEAYLHAEVPRVTCATFFACRGSRNQTHRSASRNRFSISMEEPQKERTLHESRHRQQPHWPVTEVEREFTRVPNNGIHAIAPRVLTATASERDT